MVEVTSVIARWTRRLPREQYGHVEAELTATAVVGDSEDPNYVYGLLLGGLKTAVTLQLKGGDSKVNGIADPIKAPAPGADVATDTLAEDPKPAKRKRRTKAEIEAAKAVADVPTEPVVEAAPDVPDDAVPNISANPENRVNPDDDVPGDDLASDNDMSLEDLQAFITGAVKKIPVASVLEVLASYGASRTVEIPADKRLEVRDTIELLL